MSNPFGEETENDGQTVDLGHEEVHEQGHIAVDAVETDEDVDVDVAPADDDEADSPPSAQDGTGEQKPAKEKKESTRAAVPDGFIAPVAFAKVLTDHLREEHETLGVRKGPDEVVAPQVVYSYIKNNGPDSKNPFPAVKGDDTNPETGQPYAPGRALVLKADEGLAWWDAKDVRVAEGKAERAAKAASKAAKAQTSEQAAAETGEVSTGPVEEAE